MLLVNQPFFVCFLKHLLNVYLVWLTRLWLSKVYLKHCVLLRHLLTHKLWHWSHWNGNWIKKLFHHQVLLECINDRHVSSLWESRHLSFLSFLLVSHLLLIRFKLVPSLVKFQLIWWEYASLILVKVKWQRDLRSHKESIINSLGPVRNLSIKVDDWLLCHYYPNHVCNNFCSLVVY